MPARVVSISSAPEYHPPLHHGVVARRLQGMEAGSTERFVVGHSAIAPGGGVDAAPTAFETVYVVLHGELRLTTYAGDGSADQQLVVCAGDSVHMPAGTQRSLHNAGNEAATMLVVLGTAG